MREKTIRVDLDILRKLSSEHRPSGVARKLGISPQRFINYREGRRDVPESIFNAIRVHYNISEYELIAKHV